MRKVIAGLGQLKTLLTKPFTVIFENIGNFNNFSIWFLFTIVTGQFGILANFIVRSYANNTPLSISLYIESINGSFYTFAIALIASLLGPIFTNLVESERLEYKTLKVFTIIGSIFFLFFAGIVYASIQSKAPINIFPQNLSLDVTQILTYIAAITLASYAYCVLRLEYSGDRFRDLNEPLFNEQNDAEVERILETEHDTNVAPGDIAL